MTASSKKSESATPRHADRGRPEPLGAVFDGEGVNVAVLSGVARSVSVCLFDDGGNETQMELPARTGACWHGYFPGVRPGQRYGFRVDGPWQPEKGHLCHPSKLLLDPWARAFEGSIEWNDALFPRQPDEPKPGPNTADTAPFMMKSAVGDTSYDWEDDRPPRRSMADTVAYETHVKGFTKRHPGIPEELRGTFAGLAHAAAIEHFQKLGVTAVELLPCFQFIHRRRLIDCGLRNYWGYDPVGFFAPHNEYASDGTGQTALREFKDMVKALHRAGIEVFLDVVYNHTGEGGDNGPALSFRGFDNPGYYCLEPDDPSRLRDFSGTDNTLDADSALVVETIHASLRYWVADMHVDGFRFDEAPVLLRDGETVRPDAPFLQRVRTDPMLAETKFIAEPWDASPNGYSLGRFPKGWSEWNDRFRDSVRGYWACTRGRDAVAEVLSGSPTTYASAERPPQATVNFVTAHDGFTLRDLVTYEKKYNHANCEDNRDGADHNHSWNCGEEGETDDPEVQDLRARQKRNLIACVLLSRGIPMLLGGDEIGRTQRGNNNAYCHDGELSWYDWENVDEPLLDFVAGLVRMRMDNPLFRADRWPEEGEARSVRWFAEDACEIALGEGEGPNGPACAVFRAGDENPGDFVLLLNPTAKDAQFALPDRIQGEGLRCVLDTAAEPPPEEVEETAPPSESQTIAPHSMRLFRAE